MTTCEACESRLVAAMAVPPRGEPKPVLAMHMAEDGHVARAEVVPLPWLHRARVLQDNEITVAPWRQVQRRPMHGATAPGNGALCNGARAH